MHILQDLAEQLKSILGSNFPYGMNSGFSVRDFQVALMDAEPLLTEDQVQYFNEQLADFIKHDDMVDMEDDWEDDYICDGPGWCKECGGHEEEWSEE
jgi:hypothetical protein